MWKVLLADDENLIVKGLTKLIDWNAMDIEVVGEAMDGLTADRMIRELNPDLVVSDIRMPGLTGLELLERHKGGAQAPKFIFVSGYEEFEYVRQALSGGAVDYLLKPVSAQTLEKSVRKALGLMADSNAAALFRQSSVPMKDFFNQLTANHEITGTDLYENFASLLGGKDSPVFMGLCFGLSRESSHQLDQLPYERQLLQSFVVFNTARDDLERSGYGCFLRKDDRRCCMLGIFSPGEDIDAILRQVIERTADKTGYRLRVGAGHPCRSAEELMATYEDSLRAFDLYYFEQKELLHWDGVSHQPSATNENFDDAVKQVFHSIVAKADSVEADVDRVLDIIADLHYNNRLAAYSRTMVFTGDLCQQLYARHLLTGSFSDRLDSLQRLLSGCNTYGELREQLQSYFRDILPGVYHAASRKSTAEIYKVQQYIQEHYHEELSLKALAEVARVSPHYFSAYFKAETGQNYKAYLTGVRMEKALSLVLDTDLKSYEIAEKVGYNNVRRFVDAFRTAYQMSPVDYRKLHRQNTPLSD